MFFFFILSTTLRTLNCGNYGMFLTMGNCRIYIINRSTDTAHRIQHYKTEASDHKARSILNPKESRSKHEKKQNLQTPKTRPSYNPQPLSLQALKPLPHGFLVNPSSALKGALQKRETV